MTMITATLILSALVLLVSTDSSRTGE